MTRLPVAWLCRLIGRWNEGDAPLADQLSRAIGRLIQSRELPAGRLLPSEREFAARLSISRGTVVAAYTKLRESGLLESRHGSGHQIVSLAVTEVANTQATGTRLTGEDVFFPSDIDMTSGALEASPVLRDVLESMRGRSLNAAVAGHGYNAAGLLPLRWAIAHYYGELGYKLHADNVLITSGAQQALWLAFNALLGSNSSVVVEDPTYRGALEALRRREARIAPVPLTAAGIDLGRLDEALVRRPSLVYLSPQCQNPTGTTFDSATRRALAELLQKRSVLLVEDTSQNELHTDAAAKPLPLFFEMGLEHTVAIGTLSKLFWGGLRIGWIVSSPEIIRRLVSYKAASDLGSSVIDQHIALRLLERVPEARSYRQTELVQHLGAAEAAIRANTSGWQWARPAGGSALWIRIPGMDGVRTQQLAARKRLVLSAGPGYSVAETFNEYLRLPFVRDEALLTGAIRTIAQLTCTSPAYDPPGEPATTPAARIGVEGDAAI